MNIFDVILTRRSIRNFTEQKIEDKLLEKLLKAAMYAPSARNYQPWHFVVVDKSEILNKISEVHPYAAMAKQAQAGILVCGDLEIEPSEEYNAINCSAATQNILLAAHAEKLGSVWLGVYPRTERVKEMRKLFDLPEHILPVSLVMLGYAKEIPKHPQRFREERIHRNKW